MRLVVARSDRLLIVAGLAVVAIAAAGGAADRATGWVAPAFDAVAHQFYEGRSALAALRRPSQLTLVRVHLAIFAGLAAGGLLAAPKLGGHARRWWGAFCLGYAIRAAIWIAGGNLPLVPGDSCHYLEVASSVYRGEGPVKHYVESFFRDYPEIRRGRGVLDDWATPLQAHVLAGSYRLVGVVPGRSIETTVAVAKGTSFVLNLLCLPALYAFGRRRYGPGVGLGAMALLAILPVHAIYAGFVLRESLVALTSILAVAALAEVGPARGRSAWGWGVAAGALGGLAILARNTALALAAAAGLHALAAHGRRRLGPLLAGGLVLGLVIAPWAWATYQAYGEPFYTYTKFFPYNFSWTVHHYDRGITEASRFYTRANAPEIARIKLKTVVVVAVYSTMILGLPVVLGFLRRLRAPGEGRGRDADVLAATILAVFVVATLVNVADITQVTQLGRYYLPAYALMLPTAVAGLREWAASRVDPRALPVLGGTLAALLWADPSWAHDASWLTAPYQLHWPALREAGRWTREHPEVVPDDARVMAWFPWEFRLASGRTTILMPRSLEGGPYELRRIDETIRQYGVSHVLWGSFEPSPHQDPEALGPYLDQLRLAAGLTDDRLVYRSPPGTPYPVRLYRLGRGRP